MKVRVTLMTENNIPVSALGDNPDQKVRKAWEAVVTLLQLQSDDLICVEQVEIVEDEK